MAAETTPSKSMKTENSEKLVSQDSVNSVSRRDEWIKLNVGGTTFMTTRTTLSKDPKSFLFRLIQDEPDLNTDKVNILWVHRITKKHRNTKKHQWSR